MPTYPFLVKNRVRQVRVGITCLANCSGAERTCTAFLLSFFPELLGERPFILSGLPRAIWRLSERVIGSEGLFVGGVAIV